mmetsp:Transcript_42092/g.112631  ORF Transcript_42092/g.112631 Transcript_42092/m.112631 type:complete len:85 (+) Transcript_42092:540-794(+)
MISHVDTQLTWLQGSYAKSSNPRAERGAPIQLTDAWLALPMDTAIAILYISSRTGAQTQTSSSSSLGLVFHTAAKIPVLAFAPL